jgi:hypothetical protein
VDSDDVAAVVAEVTTLVNEHYVDPAAAVQITRAPAASLAGRRYAADEQSLAAAVTADLQSVNGDQHLRLVYHAAPRPASEPDADALILNLRNCLGGDPGAARAVRPGHRRQLGRQRRHARHPHLPRRQEGPGPPAVARPRRRGR